MDTKGIDQMLSVMRAAAAKASAPAGESQKVEAGASDFAQVLQNSINQVNQAQQEAGGMAAKFAAGDSNANLHDVMISLQKANLSFQEMVQVRNKLVSAYNDVMNMQV